MREIIQQVPGKPVAGTIYFPYPAPAEGFLSLLQFLDAHEMLKSGDSLLDSLSRLGLVFDNDDTAMLHVMTSGQMIARLLKRDPVMRELIDVMGDCGFSGEVVLDHGRGQHPQTLIISDTSPQAWQSSQPALLCA